MFRKMLGKWSKRGALDSERGPTFHEHPVFERLSKDQDAFKVSFLPFSSQIYEAFPVLKM